MTICALLKTRTRPCSKCKTERQSADLPPGKRVCKPCRVEYLKNGGNIYLLSKNMGHTHLSTTELYLKFLTPEEMAAIEKLGSWDEIMETLKQRLAEQQKRHAAREAEHRLGQPLLLRVGGRVGDGLDRLEVVRPAQAAGQAVDPPRPGQGQRQGRLDGLERAAISGQREGGAQRLVAAHQLAQRPLQRLREHLPPA